MAPRGRPHGAAAGSLQQARWIALATLLVTIGLSYSSVQYLGRIVSSKRAPAVGAKPADWQDVIHRVEYNLEHHLPHQLTDQLAELGVGQRPQGIIGEGSRELIAQEQPDATRITQRSAVSDSKKPLAATVTSAQPMSAPREARKASQATCNVEENTEYYNGDPVGPWGSINKVDSWEKCCQLCLDFVPEKGSYKHCSVWDWCGDKESCKDQYQECWLKYVVHPGSAYSHSGPLIPWTAGLLDQPGEEAVEDSDPDEDRSFHIVITAEGSATHWQSRLHYYWYKKVKAKCEAEGKCDMGGFTRILHSGKADDLMQEIPTFVAQPLPPDKHDHKGYIVLNRPYSIYQWVTQAQIKEKYVIMSEPDHVWLKPMPNIMKGRAPAAYAFFYIAPATTEQLPITQRFLPNITQLEASRIAPMGNAPTMMRWDDLATVAPIWMNMSLAIFHDPVASKEWGWVQEMYAFTIAVYKAGIYKVDTHKKMMAQPPWDAEFEPFYLLHFTYGMDYSHKGVFTPGKYGEWRFDKRTYAQLPPPRRLGEPPPGMANKLVRHLVHCINEASTVIPGWDEYAATGVAKEQWDGTLPDDGLHLRP